MNWTKCQVFTPLNVVNMMLNEIEYKHGIFGKKIIDNACGNGNFLVEIVERYIKDGLDKKYSKAKIANSIEKNIFGCEYNLNFCEECKIRLQEIATFYDLRNIEWQVYNVDGLEFGEDNTFDYVVGNPPYIAYKDLDHSIRPMLKSKFKSCENGKYDYSYAFIERGLKLLKPTGKMVYITPANMFKTTFGDNLRKFIKPYLLKVIDCSQAGIFDVLTSPAITVFAKNAQVKVILYREYVSKIELIIEKEKLENKWIFSDFKDSGKRKFGDDFKVSYSIATLRNDVFIHDVIANKSLCVDGYEIEPKLLKIAKSPKSERKGCLQKIIFPYRYEKNTLKKYEENEFKSHFPNAYKFLLLHKDELNNSDKDKGAKWYEFGRSQALQHINQEKLLISPIVTKKIAIYKLKKSEVPYSGMFIVCKNNTQLNLDTAKEILMTNKFHRYVESIGIRMSGESIKITSKDIEDYTY